ncbi:M4 family metallopeptidase [Streptomyces sp. MUM 178J]|uniref:M4 family metallopeptidase n=1 Tax=Streptomyces sp. MUM 178J TaxID=2791991 RepID=UPI001F037357|nr:M4 family metallopeptidase [Streptomyces sp. MUM 178J]WRQ79361.1 M4 family metallopeptidase [Streptomyces sp. MUM 178J]
MTEIQPTQFCTIVPPHVLDRLARSQDPALSAPARRTLEADAVQRTRRQLTAVAAPVPAPEATADVDAGADAEGAPECPQRTVHDCRNGTDLPGVVVRAEGDEPVGDATVNRVYSGLGATFELLLKEYGRSSLDGTGLPLNASVHFGDRYGNAFWDGEQMVFGDGDGEIFLDFSIPVDVIAHELAHGLTQHTANLSYYGQPGALNESVSDVMGSLVKQYTLGQSADEADWLIGAGLLAPRVTGVALRSMKAPGTAYDDDVLGRDPQPATMQDYVRTGRDNGGVHINSGIPNHAFYLFATRLGGKAWERAGQVWFDVLTGGELAVDADFARFARLTVSAAAARYGEGAEHEAVVKAWAQVGVETA